MNVLTVRRLDKFPFVVGSLLLTGLAIVAWVNWPLSSGAKIVISGSVLFGLSFAYLVGPVAYVRLTDRWLLVANTYILHRISPSTVKSIGGYDNLGVDILLSDGRTIPIKAFESSMSIYARSFREYQRRGQKLECALKHLLDTATGDHQSYGRKVRIGSVLATVVMIFAPVLAAVAGLPNA